MTLSERIIEAGAQAAETYLHLRADLAAPINYHDLASAVEVAMVKTLLEAGPSKAMIDACETLGGVWDDETWECGLRALRSELDCKEGA